RFRDLLIARLHFLKPSAICFSGGGIRSATFGLGVLQEFARRSKVAGGDAVLGMLSKIDYLSTVSGGGYLGAWFSAWSKHSKGTAAVVKELAATPTAKLDPEPSPVSHLRKYAAYLSPKWGLLSADTWTLVSTVLRNILINWLVLIPALAAILAVPECVRTIVACGGPYWLRR